MDEVFFQVGAVDDLAFVELAICSGEGQGVIVCAGALSCPSAAAFVGSYVVVPAIVGPTVEGMADVADPLLGGDRSDRSCEGHDGAVEGSSFHDEFVEW